ncbi:MAG: hypothetical protein Q8J64_09320 [Thermodesulfovibrionales bacterium]|nr:hypothetical protein [Thermodesulfovibrionales bacterium]
MTNGMKTGRNIGAATGAVAFLIFGLVPGFHFGSHGALVTLSHLSGGPVEPNIIVRMLVVAGIALGIFSIGAVSVVLGSVFGTAIGYVTEAVTSPVREAAAVRAENK